MPARIDLTGQKFGKLTVLEKAQSKNGRTYWLCQCECGNKKEIQTDLLRNGKTKSCGCYKRENIIKLNKNRIIDLTGQKFGKLTVIKQVESYRDHSAWLCQCECGNTKIVNSVELKNNDTLSCGCLRSSFGEKSIERILKENNILYKKEYTFDDLINENGNKLKFDFAIFENNNLKCLIEYDGEQHYLYKTDNFWKDTLKKRQERDIIKNNYCLENNILLYRIPYWEKNNLSLNILFEDKYLIKKL